MGHRHTVFVARDFMMAEVLDDIEQRLLARGIEVVRGPEPSPGEKLVFPRERWQEWFGRAEVMMFSSRSVCSRELLAWAPRVSGIVNPAIGLETVDVAAASDLGIIVGHGATPENFNGMAEATVMLMLMLMYDPGAAEEVLRGARPRPTPKDAWARMMMGRTIGLIGFGRIGRGVAERLAGFRVNILAYDPFIGPDAAPPGAKLVELDELLASSDIVSVLVSVTPSARKLIGERELALMKPHAYLVNTARGEAIDEAALIRVLKERRIAGAALDTFEVEPVPADSPLRRLDNVLITPHMVGQTKDAFASLGPAAEENITRILRGEPPLYCKNLEALPAWRTRLMRLAHPIDAA